MEESYTEDSEMLARNGVSVDSMRGHPIDNGESMTRSEITHGVRRA